MQKIVEKYKSKGFTILAINTDPTSDNVAEPLLKNNKYEFIGLRVPDEKWAGTNYKGGIPGNFILDPEGRIIFQPHVRDAVTMRALDQEVAEVLAWAAKNKREKAKGD